MINYLNTLLVTNRTSPLPYNKFMPDKSGEQQGFTLIELMVVIVIISILAAFVAPKLMHRLDEANVTEAKIQIKNLETGLRLFKMDNGFYPSTGQGLQSLIAAPEAGEIPENYKSGGYLEKRTVPLDPWGNSYMYISPGMQGDYDIISYGADGAAGGDKYDADIVNWEL
jgi:general secretion pathway protein G